MHFETPELILLALTIDVFINVSRLIHSCSRSRRLNALDRLLAEHQAQNYA